MIEFATLFLGLYVGVAPVEVLVGPDVASVEMRLDGEWIGELEGPPWVLPCQLGPPLEPHELVAVARDAEGRELARARQWINVPHPYAEARVVLGRDPEDGGGMALVSWNSSVGSAPQEVRVTLDGEPLEVEDPTRIRLPDDEPGRLHFLRVELEFGAGVLAAAEMVYGGRYGESVQTELSGIPAWIRERGTPSPDELRGWLRRGGEALEVVGVEKGLSDLVVVPDLASREWLLTLRHGSRSGSGYRFEVSFPRDLRIRLLWPLVETLRQPGSRRSLIRASPELSPWDAGFLAYVHAYPLPADAGPQRIADAVAMAGLVAAEPGRRRGVLLVSSGTAEDASQLEPADVRGFLEELGVPLFVWHTGEGSPNAAWGPAEPVTSLRRLEKGFKRIGRVLDRQRVVWVAEATLARDVALPQGGPLLRVGVEPYLEGLPPEDPEDDDTEVVEVELADAPAPRIVTPSLDPTRLDRALKAMQGAPSTSRLGPFDVHYDLENVRSLMALAPVAATLETVYRERYGVVPSATGREAVVLFAHESSYREYAGEEIPADAEGIAGHAGGGLAVVLVGERDPDQVRSLLVHELVHLLNRRVFEARLPPWLEEGLADEPALYRYDAEGRPRPDTYWGDSRLAGSGSIGGQVQVQRKGPVGALHDLASHALRGGLVPLPELLAMSWDRFLEPEGRTFRYAESAFFVRYLLEGRRGRYREGFRRFLRSVAEGGDSGPRGLEAELGEDLGTIEAGFRSWLRFEQATLRLKGQ